MKFAHLADCHIGGWKEDKLKELSLKAFEEAIDICIKENTAFVLISGDLFNTALPNIDLLKQVAFLLNKLREHDISVYVIAGSHDFSPSGKTMLDVLENAGLIENVTKFKDDKLIFTLDKTNVKITGLYGKRGSLEKNEYETLNKDDLEKEKGFKVFMFHALLNELKPKELELVEGQPINILPKNFNYYAGGHPHFVLNENLGNGIIAYPGPLFPNNFAEFEKLKHGGFFIVDDKLNIKYVPIKLKDVVSIFVDANDKTPKEVESELSKINDIIDKIVTIRVEGVLKEGKPSDINFRNIFPKFGDAYFLMKNTNKLSSKELEKLEIKSGKVEDVENIVVKDYLDKIKDLQKEKLVLDLIDAFNKEKLEGERNIDFENRIVKDVVKILNIEI